MSTTEKNPIEGRFYHLTGIVQGVGFRPFVYHIATLNQLRGDVRNAAEGVLIHVYGSPAALENFDRMLRNHPPAHAVVNKVEMTPIPPGTAADFQILESVEDPSAFLPVSPDLAICADCRADILDPENSRYAYPFTNCTNCGPRFSILRAIPYDRCNTTMQEFKLCAMCEAEYKDPINRRFHAQPIACADCGPRLQWLAGLGTEGASEEAIGAEALRLAADTLKAGKIIAIKGLGGFHLACDAQHDAAIQQLRVCKHRSQKPFALMAKDLAAVRAYCMVSDAEAELLTSAAAPIVLLRKKPGCPLPEALAPTQRTLGMMLPYTPLHVLLFEQLDSDCLIMTSANLSEEPLVYRDRPEDVLKLSQLSDGILTHNRAIQTRLDDSVVRYDAKLNQPIQIRRSRGYAPQPLLLAEPAECILAVGAELKNTICLTRDQYAFLSHHIGDMENVETADAFSEAIAHYEEIFRIQPQAIACDLHPNSLSTQAAERIAVEKQLPLFRVQHHEAHIASVLAEHHRFNDQLVIGLAFDGTGYGTDGTIWGGEALYGSARGFTREFHLQRFALPGGDAAIRHPARQALALLHRLELSWETWLPSVQHTRPEERQTLRFQLAQGVNCVETSSMGRLFDAVSSLLGVCQTVTYEGEAAIELENIADSAANAGYVFALRGSEICVEPVIQAMLTDLKAGIPLAVIAAGFHQAVIDLSVALAKAICIKMKPVGPLPVVLSGGVWQNQLLLAGAATQLRQAGFEVLIPQKIPLNDGCIAFGQAVIADARMKELTHVSRNSGQNS